MINIINKLLLRIVSDIPSQQGHDDPASSYGRSSRIVEWPGYGR